MTMLSPRAEIARERRRQMQVRKAFEAGLDPAAALERHDSLPALAAVPDALLETGPTGTNVGDLAIYLRGPA